MTTETQPMPTDAERAEFEEMMRRETFDDLSRVSDGSYKSYEARVGWIAWQAARRTPAPVGVEPAHWQKRHQLRTNGEWKNTNEHDAKWWRDNSQGWEIRALYTHPQPAAQAVKHARKLYECVACKHLYEEKVNQCDCLENPRNQYNEWSAFPKAIAAQGDNHE